MPDEISIYVDINDDDGEVMFSGVYKVNKHSKIGPQLCDVLDKITEAFKNLKVS